MARKTIPVSIYKGSLVKFGRCGGRMIREGREDDGSSII
jgi:hypothetical protein